MRPGIPINIPEEISHGVIDNKVPFCIFKVAQSFSNFIWIYQGFLLKINVLSYHEVI